MPIEILVVDDNLASAETYAQLIERKTLLVSFATDDPSTALEKIRTESIKVVVLDQKMPKKTGTTLYEEMKRIDPRVKAILLSGEAEAKDVGEAFILGFVRYLPKNDIIQLPELVHLQYVRYHAEFENSYQLTLPVGIYSKRKVLFLFGPGVYYNLLRIEVLSEEHIFDDKWVTVKQINAGEKIKEIDKIEIDRSFILEESDEVKTTITLPILEKVKAGLEGAISSRFTDTFSQKSAVEVTREYELPQEPADPTKLYVISRHYQRAPIYRKIRCLIVRKCECCNSEYPFPLIVYQLTSKIATRQRDYLSDKNIREILTGTESY